MTDARKDLTAETQFEIHILNSLLSPFKVLLKVNVKSTKSF